MTLNSPRPGLGHLLSAMVNQCRQRFGLTIRELLVVAFLERIHIRYRLHSPGILFEIQNIAESIDGLRKH